MTHHLIQGSYVELSKETAMVITENNGVYKVTPELNAITVAAYKSLCSDSNAITKADFDAQMEKARESFRLQITKELSKSKL